MLLFCSLYLSLCVFASGGHERLLYTTFTRAFRGLETVYACLRAYVVCVCVCVCMCVCMCAYVRAFRAVHACLRMDACVCDKCVCVSVRVYVRVNDM